MNDFLKNIIEGSGVTPSEVCLQAFNQNFENALNVEWVKKENYFEAIFYKDNLEHIARFDVSGTMLEYMLNLPDGYLPEIIKNISLEKGEIMNSVLRNKGNSIEYEVIVRDSDLNRYLLTISDLGVLLQEKML